MTTPCKGHPLGSAGLRPRRHRARGRHAGGDCGWRSRSMARRAPRPALCAGGAAKSVRPQPRPARRAHSLGLLPRAPQLHHRYDQPHRSADRALCPWISGFDPGEAHAQHARKWRPIIPITWAAISSAGWWICGSSSPGPVARWVPYSTPLKGVYLCSSSTPREAACTACAATTLPKQPCAQKNRG